jgi:hypothetical protein
MPEEIKPTVVEALAEFEPTAILTLRTRDVEKELLKVIKMRDGLKNYLNTLIKGRLEEVIEFGKKFPPQFSIGYLQELFSPAIFFDHLLTITQQYFICNVDIMTHGGVKAENVGFNLALFGKPGAEKAFASKERI